MWLDAQFIRIMNEAFRHAASPRPGDSAAGESSAEAAPASLPAGMPDEALPAMPGGSAMPGALRPARMPGQAAGPGQAALAGPERLAAQVLSGEGPAGRLPFRGAEHAMPARGAGLMAHAGRLAEGPAPLPPVASAPDIIAHSPLALALAALPPPLVALHPERLAPAGLAGMAGPEARLGPGARLAPEMSPGTEMSPGPETRLAAPPPGEAPAIAPLAAGIPGRGPQGTGLAGPGPESPAMLALRPESPAVPVSAPAGRAAGAAGLLPELAGLAGKGPAMAGMAPALIINAAMIPGWPLPGFAQGSMAAPAFRPRRMSEAEWLEHLAAEGLNPALLEALRQLRAKPAPKRRLLRFFAMLLAALASLLETIEAELLQPEDPAADALAAEGLDDEAARRRFTG